MLGVFAPGAPNGGVPHACCETYRSGRSLGGLQALYDVPGLIEWKQKTPGYVPAKSKPRRLRKRRKGGRGRPPVLTQRYYLLLAERYLKLLQEGVASPVATLKDQDKVLGRP